MAWEDAAAASKFERNGVKLGSAAAESVVIAARRRAEPIDEFAFALQRITTAYEERFSRKPFVNELLYALLEAQRQKRSWEPFQRVMYQIQKA